MRKIRFFIALIMSVSFLALVHIVSGDDVCQSIVNDNLIDWSKTWVTINNQSNSPIEGTFYSGKKTYNTGPIAVVGGSFEDEIVFPLDAKSKPALQNLGFAFTKIGQDELLENSGDQLSVSISGNYTSPQNMPVNDLKLKKAQNEYRVVKTTVKTCFRKLGNGKFGKKYIFTINEISEKKL